MNPLEYVAAMKTIANLASITLSIAVAVVFCITGCSNSGTSDATAFNTSVSGQVFLMDDREKLLDDPSGILVMITSPVNSYLTTSDTHGNWQSNGLQPGSYDISFVKAGYTGAKLFHVEVKEAKPAVAVTQFLYAPPKYTVTFDAVTITASGLGVGGAYMHSSENTPLGVFQAAVVIAGRSPSLSVEDTSSYMLCAIATASSIPKKDTVVDMQGKLYLGTLQLRFAKGETLYFRAYPFASKGTYFDQNTQKDVISGYGQGSNILSTVMP
ncbi:MAG TPA: carboxypeptidase-like regulatory domain-containing protein [Candidatus Kapabacteria bacterium]|nr:carboxypeptidase-like regulatory domain-containing protein [Candidatus Kapabacteria bacterium]